jgi:hypothetical protein
VSTILKALRRLEDDKAREGAPRPLREEVASGFAETPRRRGAWVPIAALLAGAGLGASAWWFWPYERVSAPAAGAAAPVAAAAPEHPAAAPTRPGMPAARPQLAPPQLPKAEGVDLPVAAQKAEIDPEALRVEGPPADAFSSPVEVVERPPAEPRIAPVPEKVVAQAPAAGAKPAAPAPVARPAAPPAPAPSSAPAPALDRPAAPPAPVAQKPVQQATAPAPRAPQPETHIWDDPTRDLEPEPPAPKPGARAVTSAEVIAGAAEVHVKRTQWHPDGARRSADLEVGGQTRSVHEGDAVGLYVVSEIRPSGVVLLRDGQKVERGIGSK